MTSPATEVIPSGVEGSAFLHPRIVLFLRRAAQTLLMSGLLFLLMIWSLFAGMMLSTLAVAALTNQDNVGVDFPFLAVGYQTAAAIAIVLLIAGAILASRLFHWKRLE